MIPDFVKKQKIWIEIFVRLEVKLIKPNLSWFTPKITFIKSFEISENVEFVTFLTRFKISLLDPDNTFVRNYLWISVPDLKPKDCTSTKSIGESMPFGQMVFERSNERKRKSTEPCKLVPTKRLSLYSNRSLLQIK